MSALAPIMHGCNIKLEKAGGIRRALSVTLAARQLGQRVWIGSMVGSSLNSNAAAALLVLADDGFGDVDGGLLVTEECQRLAGGFQWVPAKGLVFPEGTFGFGLVPKP